MPMVEPEIVRGVATPVPTFLSLGQVSQLPTATDTVEPAGIADPNRIALVRKA
jgi:hypothetical protein